MARRLSEYNIESRRMRIQLTLAQWAELDDRIGRDDRSISDVVERILRNERIFRKEVTPNGSHDHPA